MTAVRRDFLWNFRDISDADPTRLRAGLLYRSSSLTYFQGDGRLHRWITARSLRLIIDLRSPDERGAPGPHTAIMLCPPPAGGPVPRLVAVFDGETVGLAVHVGQAARASLLDDDACTLPCCDG